MSRIHTGAKPWTYATPRPSCSHATTASRHEAAPSAAFGGVACDAGGPEDLGEHNFSWYTIIIRLAEEHPHVKVEHRDNVDPETLACWNRICRDTTLAMQDHCMRYITPVSHAVEHDWGVLEGTGAYVEFEGKRLLLSNEHVLHDWETRQFCHQFHGCEDVFKLGKPLALEGHPVDAAVCVVEDKIWDMRTHGAEDVPQARVATRHHPVRGELLFFAGYPEKRSKSLYKNLITRATRLVTQEPQFSPIPDLHPHYFLLNYAPGQAQSLDPTNPVDLSDPHGLSGSLVWNTRRIECLAQKREWSPDLAQVTGLLCRWNSPTSTVMAIRIEVVLDFLGRHAR